jgi:hypothetical protein
MVVSTVTVGLNRDTRHQANHEQWQRRYPHKACQSVPRDAKQKPDKCFGRPTFAKARLRRLWHHKLNIDPICVAKAGVTALIEASVSPPSGWALD